MFGKTIDPSCYSGTFFEYCASSTAKETCCGVCTVVPIGFPGTLLAWTLGSLCNLLYALIFRAEAPYNLLFQFLSVDAALISLMHRFFDSTNRIDLWDYCFVPLSICSCIPIAVAIALGRIEDLHVIGPGASMQLRALSHKATGFTDGDEVAVYIKDRLHKLDAQHDPEKTAGRGRSRLVGTHGATKESVSQGLPDHGSFADSEPPLHALHENVFASLPHPHLPEEIVWFFFGHLVFFSIFFTVLYASVSNTSQANCNEQFGLDTHWRPIMASLTALNLLVGYFFWYLMYENVYDYHHSGHRFHRVARFSGVHAILNFTGNASNAKERDVTRKQERMIRVGICFLVYLIWVVPYLTVWITAVENFMLLGPNPWVFEQVGAATSVFIPFLIVWRGVVDRKFQLICKKQEERQLYQERLDGAGSPIGTDPTSTGSAPEGGVPPTSGRLALLGGTSRSHRRQISRSRVK
ncbi:uncharacterized protein JCM6883_004274 [Sporobolomyces salmoneus]|uniref:uncharacterized protein n=1 Tax=Sporobolomyces salmoneus TaxID=183962 RepID=UPI00317F131B